MNLPALFQGFTNVDEADIVFDLFRFYENAARDRELIGFIWPDTGMNGPFRSYLYAPTLFLGSYVLQVPVDVTMRLIPWLSVPVTGWFLYLAMRHLVGPYAAGWGILLFLGSVYFTVFNTLSVGEVWYTHFRRFEFPNALTQLLVLEAQFGDVGIYRNALIGEAPTPSSKPLPDYDLRSIVQGFLQRGMMAPTSDAN